KRLRQSSDKCSAQTVASARSPCGVSIYPTRPTTIIGGVSRITILGMVCLNGYRPTGSKEFMEYTLLLCILHKQRTVLFFDMAVLRTYCIKGSSRTATQVDQHISALINTRVNTSQVHIHSEQIYRTHIHLC
ncbi:hypothetical protein ALC56_09467, partial [Trachymyrmex septentrionalis]